MIKIVVFQLKWFIWNQLRNSEILIKIDKMLSVLLSSYVNIIHYHTNIKSYYMKNNNAS